MKVAVLGAGGLVGRELCAAAPSGAEVLPLTHAQLDIRDTDGVARVLDDASPAWVINAAGVTDVDLAERDRDLAFAVNALAVGSLARLCHSRGAGLLHFSTDFVFDGTKDGCYAEDDEPKPINVYGASKWDGEKLVRQHTMKHLIIRTQWVFGAGGTSFLSTLRERALNRVPMRVVADQFGGCTYAPDLAQWTWAMVGTLTGTYHVANRGRVSRFDIARRVFEALGAAELVSPCSSADVRTIAPRPANTPLCVDKVERALGRALPSWSDAVDRYAASSRGGQAAPPRSATEVAS